MDVEFADRRLERLFTDPGAKSRLDKAVVTAFRKAVQFLLNASDERALHARKGLRFEKLKGDRAGQHSLRLNDQWRLAVELAGDPKRIIILEIVDYH